MGIRSIRGGHNHRRMGGQHIHSIHRKHSISLGLWLSISRSLAVVVSMVGIWVSIVSMVGIPIGVWVGSISIVSIQSIGISLSFWFSSNSCEQAESSNSNGFHFDVIKLEELAGLPM